jgi:hypothetical protein
MQRSDQSVGPGSWYWPTRSKLLVGLIIAVVVLILSIVVNPRGGGDFPGGGGGGGGGGAGSARVIALRIEQMPIPPFNVYRLTHVRCVLSADGTLASCVSTARYTGPKSTQGAPVPSHRAIPGVRVSFVVRSGRILRPVCSNHHPQNIFCAS